MVGLMLREISMFELAFKFHNRNLVAVAVAVASRLRRGYECYLSHLWTVYHLVQDSQALKINKTQKCKLDTARFFS